MSPAVSLTECSRYSILADRIVLAACFAPFVFIACCAAQEAPGTFPVDGVVENSLTHQPVARALVESASDAVLTDSQGRFELHLPESAADLRVRRPGYEGPDTGRLPVQLRVNVSSNTKPVTILLLQPPSPGTSHSLQGTRPPACNSLSCASKLREAIPDGGSPGTPSLTMTAHSDCRHSLRPPHTCCAPRRRQTAMDHTRQAR